MRVGAASVGSSLKHLYCRLILDARNLGKTFTDIAKMLPARNVTTLRKHYTIMSKSKVLLIFLAKLAIFLLCFIADSPVAALQQ